MLIPLTEPNRSSLVTTWSASHSDNSHSVFQTGESVSKRKADRYRDQQRKKRGGGGQRDQRPPLRPCSPFSGVTNLDISLSGTMVKDLNVNIGGRDLVADTSILGKLLLSRLPALSRVLAPSLVVGKTSFSPAKLALSLRNPPPHLVDEGRWFLARYSLVLPGFSLLGLEGFCSAERTFEVEK
ncbi:NADH dehydrogenase iron-sulfur protein [Striga asiatica]|uniref:NADH dehydrogenase iron-sulfur protein n=1 Tax=Striga asiatica TaxID=4170 RepID=A0A5A7PJA4_STRAF|nr:NADH dehydrogenase iron-sulfur protein [Striga asiatica]